MLTRQADDPNPPGRIVDGQRCCRSAAGRRWQRVDRGTPV